MFSVYRMLFLAFKKIRIVKKHLSSDSHNPIKTSSIGKSAIALTWGNFHLPMNTSLVNLCIIMMKCLKKILKTDHEK